MGERDHSTKCKVCGLQRGGLNDYKCHCDVTLLNDVRWQQSRSTLRGCAFAEWMPTEEQNEGAPTARIEERHNDTLIVAESTNSERWTVRSTDITGNKPLTCSSFLGKNAEFEAGRIFQQLVTAALCNRGS
jgi:hypothetical protein